MDYGTVNYKGKELTLTQQPYADTLFRPGYLPKDVFCAIATDLETGDDFLVCWNIREGAAYCEPEDCCDWSKYYVLEGY